jgi:protein required for attachment to host cells
VRALAEFVAGRAAPPWRWARELIQDGLVDAELALSPRGRRCLERAHPVSAPHGRARNFCVIVADSVRARVLLLDDARVAAGPATSELVEVAEMTNPTLRAHDVDVVADTGTGHRGRTQAPLPLNGPPDHRDHRRRDHERRFAARIADEAAGKWRRYAACELVVVASPVMLGLLRPAIDRLIRAKDQIAVRELAGDLTNLTGSRIHDLLAADKLLPERGRRLLPITTPGAPV